MLERLRRFEAKLDRLLRPLVRFGYQRLRLSPARATWAGFLASAAAGGAVWVGHVYLGLGLILLGQVLDMLDGSIAREFGLASPGGDRLDRYLDRASEVVIFIGFVGGGLVTAKLAALAFAAIMLLSTISQRSRIDPGAKRWLLYLGIWVPYPVLFTVIFVVNLAGYVTGLLLLDLHFQRRMDTLEGDFDTVASRAALEEMAEPDAFPGARPA